MPEDIFLGFLMKVDKHRLEQMGPLLCVKWCLSQNRDRTPSSFL